MQQAALVDYDYANSLQYVGPNIHRAESNNPRHKGQQHFAERHCQLQRDSEFQFSPYSRF
jgi:hypothetical protein